MSTVFYRKYRSQTLDELIGQNHIKESLNSAFLAGKLSHAYLFAGPRGTGKTSTARILAKMVNCEEKDLSKVPCNKCTFCTSIANGSNLDVVEMDAASNRGIEDIRNLRETIKLAPTSAQKKVYIIDEVHMLSTDAFNALLKTLEEPPSHVLFILATTEIQKIPETILSRVQKMEFKPATINEAATLIKKAAENEKIEIDEEAVLMLAKKAGGSFRDAVKYLDQLSSSKKIDKELVYTILGSSDFNKSAKIITAVSENKEEEVLKSLNEALESGISAKELTFNLLEILREILYIKNNLGEKYIKSEVTEENYQELLRLAEGFENTKISKILDSLQKSMEQLRFASIQELPLEIALLENCGGRGSPVASRQSSDNKNEKESINPKLVKKEVQTETEKNEHDFDQSSTVTLQDQPSHLQPLTSNSDLQKIAEKWNYILETVKTYNYSLEALLRLSRILECGESSVVIEVPYAFHQRILESAKSREMLEGILSDILGRPIKIATALGKRPVQREELPNIEVASDDEIIRIASEIFNADSVN